MSRALEVERHPCGRSSDRSTADRVVLRIAATDLVPVAAGAETVMRAYALIDLGADDVPAGPIVEVVARANGVLACRVIELVSLYVCQRCTDRIVGAQHCRVAGNKSRAA